MKNSEMFASLCGDIQKHILSNMNYEHADALVHSELASKDITDLLIIFLNWRMRFIQPRPRQVNVSANLNTTRATLSATEAAALRKLTEDFRNGRDVNGHLSRRVAHGYQRQKSSSSLLSRQDLDLLLNDWGIYHFHLSDVIEPDGFVERTSNLLFAFVSRTDVFLIDIRDHKNFHNADLLEIALTNWPDAELLSELKGILPNQNFSNDEVKILRGAGISTSFQHKGKIYRSNQTLTTAGTSSHASMTAITIVRACRHFCENLADHMDRMNAAQTGMQIPSDPNFKFLFHDDRWGIVETTVGVFYPLDKIFT